MPLLRLRVTYGRVADFLADVRDQVARGGLLVRVDVGSAERGADVALEILTPVGAARPPARVLHVLGPSGVAVELAPDALADLAAKAQTSRGKEPGTDTVHELVSDDAPAPPPPPARPAPPPSHAAQQAQKIQEALHGDKNQRMAILREQNRLLISYVLKNPQIGMEEVMFVAKNPTSSPDLLTFIGNKREWSERADIAIALVRNPKTPIQLAIKLLDFINPNELRNIAKLGNVRDQISSAARKKVLG